MSTEQGYVYFIETQDQRFIKIGYSAKPWQRMASLGPLPGEIALRIIGFIPGTFETEKWLHEKFKEYRDNGEWFRSVVPLRDFIAALGLDPDEYEEPPEKPRLRKVGVGEYRRDNFSVLFGSALKDWKRLSSGHFSDMLFMVVMLRSFGRVKTEAQPLHEKTLPLSLKELTELCGCDERTVYRELARWNDHRVASVVKVGTSLYTIQLLLQSWGQLPEFSEYKRQRGRVGASLRRAG